MAITKKGIQKVSNKLGIKTQEARDRKERKNQKEYAKFLKHRSKYLSKEEKDAVRKSYQREK